MRPIVNVPEEDRATDIGNVHKIGKDRAWFRGYPGGQTDTETQTDVLDHNTSQPLPPAK